MDAVARFGDAVRSRFGLGAGETVVVGASAGLDSTVLARLLHGAGYAVVLAHVNYGLRGAASDADEAFVRGLAAELNVPVYVEAVALEGPPDRQRRARDARYRFFGEVAAAAGAAVVAVAHHRDDQAETVLLHLVRGTGLHGLAGMPAERPLAPDAPVRLVRPLLSWSRSEIEALARSQGWAWREDASNAEPSYRRNRLRNEVLPLLEDRFGPGVAGRIAGVADRVRTLTEGAGADAAFVRYGDPRPDGGTLRLEGLQRLARAERLALYARALAQWAPNAPRTAAALAHVEALLDAQPGRRAAWPGVSVWRERDGLRFQRHAHQAAGPWAVTIGAPCATPFGTLFVTPAAPDALDAHRAAPHVEVVDAEAMAGALELRPWRGGDRFRPLGLGGSKLVSDLLTERKVPASERDGQLVLCCDDDIVWVVGHRLAEGVRVRPETARCLRLHWEPFG